MAALVLVLPFSQALPGTVRLVWNVAIFVLFLICLLTWKVRRPIGGGWWAAVSGLVIISVVSSSGSAESLTAHIFIGAQIWFFVTLGPFVIRYLASLDGGARLLGIAFLIGQSISSSAAIAQTSGISTFNQAVLLGRATGLAGHPNVLGLLAGMTVLILTAAVVGRSGRKLVLVILLLVNVTALIACGSVSSMIATLVGILVLLVSRRVPLKGPVLLSAAAAAALWILSTVAPEGLLRGPLERIRQVTGQTSNVSTLDVREQTVQYAWEGIQRDPWFGRGLDHLSGLTGDQRTVTHSVMFRTWFQGGLALGLAYATIAVLILWITLRAIRRGRDALAAALLSMTASFSLTSAALEQAYYWVPILVALSLVDPTRSRPDSEEARRLQRRLATAVRDEPQRGKLVSRL
ncbi:O-antigen ligase [Arthrobacter sp. B1805]|uniref:O-antigen ligase family protein n=1 Tax=Arthrobacter sp. B1805 TaxID=2058892 RepID=UPI0011B06B49|nr:O-antigen ligase family protein [Arthrobacter sp. B1805]